MNLESYSVDGLPDVVVNVVIGESLDVWAAVVIAVLGSDVVVPDISVDVLVGLNVKVLAAVMLALRGVTPTPVEEVLSC